MTYSEKIRVLEYYRDTSSFVYLSLKNDCDTNEIPYTQEMTEVENRIEVLEEIVEDIYRLRNLEK